MKIIFILLLNIVASSNTFSSQKNKFLLPDKSGYVFWKCDTDFCTIYLKKKNTSPEILIEKSSSPRVESLNKNLVKLFFSCGSPCNYTFFYDSKIGLSQAFEFAITEDISRNVVLVAEKNNLVAYKIFDKNKKKLFYFKRNWSPTVALYTCIVEAKFRNDSLYVKYLEGNNFKEKEEVFDNIYT